jgi:excisionase family DNA binding protein
MDMRTKKGSGFHNGGGDKLLSPQQLADHLGIGRTLAYEILAQKRIPSFTIGKLRRVRQADVDRYVEERLSAQVE